MSGKIHPIEAFMIELLDGIRGYQNSNGNIIRYWKDDTFYFAYCPKSNHIWLSYDLYKEYETKFGCSKDEIIVIMNYLLGKHLNIKIDE